jgi:hypothetical protein
MKAKKDDPLRDAATPVAGGQGHAEVDNLFYQD